MRAVRGPDATLQSVATGDDPDKGREGEERRGDSGVKLELGCKTFDGAKKDGTVQVVPRLSRPEHSPRVAKWRVR